jgi:hypothetical protein
MKRFRSLALVGLMIGVPFATSACTIDIGVPGCALHLLEPGAEFSLVCNPF